MNATFERIAALVVLQEINSKFSFTKDVKFIAWLASSPRHSIKIQQNPLNYSARQSDIKFK